MIMRFRFYLPIVFTSLIFAMPLQAQAARQDVKASVSDASLRAPADVVSGKNIRLKNRFEIGVFVYDVSLRNVLVEHPYAAHIAVGYHILEWLQLQAVGGFVFLHQESSTIRQIRAGLSPGVSRDLALPQLWQTLWNVGLDAQWAPFYGKLSLFSEYDANFQIYALLGGGLEGIERAFNIDDPPQRATRFAVGVGAGLRVFLTDRFAIRSEIKQSFGFNPPLANGDRDLGLTTWLQLGFSFLI